MKQKTYANKNFLKGSIGLNAMILLSIMAIFKPVSLFSAETPWSFSLGAGGYASSVYYGSEETYMVPVPHFEMQYQNGSFSSKLSLLNGISAMYSENHFFGSISINSGEKRDSQEYSALGISMDHSDAVKNLLKGSPTVSTLLVAEMMLGFNSRLGNFSTSFEYHPTSLESEDEDRSYQGFLASVNYMIPFSVTEKLSVTGTFSLTLMDHNYAEAWYAVERPTQELKVFKAGAGLHDMQLLVQMDYMVSKHIGVTLQSGHSLLLMDAADSPYTTSKYQMVTGLYGFYKF